MSRLLKSVYMEGRLSKLDQSVDRSKLAGRELLTIKLLHEAFYSRNLTGSVLDLGCGDRYMEGAISSAGLSYTGLDIHDVDLDKDKLPFEENTFDLVICLAVIEHLENPFHTLSEMLRVLKPGGTIYITTPNFQMDFRNFYNDYTHVTPFTPTSLSSLIKDIGFKSIGTFPGLRCKPLWCYKGKSRFSRAYWLFPFRNDTKYVPGFLKGHARSIIAIGIK